MMRRESLWLTVAIALFALAWLQGIVYVSGQTNEPFAFLALGDIHFDRLEHHDLDYVRQKHGEGDVRQIQNYSRLTETVLPKTFAEAREHVQTFKPPIAFVAQLGDFVEGLCGTPQLARRHVEDAIEFVKRAQLGVPFFITKGNHDITGPGAVEAYNQIILPFLGEQLGKTLLSASFTVRRGNTLFAFFDAYDDASLDWLERTLTEQQAQRVFVLLHPPVVPIGARSLWHLYARPEQQPQRQRLLNLLGRYHAIVLTAHLHKFGVVVRKTESGSFVQVTLNSVIPSPEVEPKQVLQGVKHYGPDLVKLEPNFEPQTEAQRREALVAERPFIAYYEYADAPGYAVFVVDASSVHAHFYVGLGKRRWRSVNLTALLQGQ
ncbi:3',5'-cyclic adenosine monophosphate phosphodiesterase CpdA [bacterium HR17]|uniref:3',5'-cyclic adenosine monophosphate phosphodiesterase CpdA n=1 Tax=Candidatus Fervidibacter japonicus TaxID=2035412 RepID=A0A2H5XBA1_9BACT|nr:3',5'-cyclic adenosine monophosphate phosphodiesterase CpdA [bacterium HR17]